jgi:hypothetical protein
MNPSSHTHLTKVPKTYNGEKTSSSINVVGKTGYLHADK